ncbi:multiple sugar ABC transporter, membrane-spanning permease protein MsmF [Lachnospiraceae bacterium KM106-2]|nr:multiple sugar ABC transporter, membrane-spanning permease protein MsmF [Lachnospiraceae bacterium KM106-2]
MQKALRKFHNWIIFLLPTFAAFVIVFLIPFVQGIWLSFCKFRTMSHVRFDGVSNYVKAFQSPDFLNALGFTTKFTIVSVITINFFAFGLALLLTKGIKGTNLFRTVFFMPNLIGGIVLGWIWQVILNGILQNFNATLVTDAKYGFWGLVILMNWQMIGYMMIIYIAAIQNVPTDLIEAAEIDGATKFQVLKKVTMPMVMPSFTICLFLTLTNSFKLFDQNYALTAGEPAKASEMLALNIYQTFYGRIGWRGVGQAKAVVFFVLVAIISITQLVITRRKEVEQ